MRIWIEASMIARGGGGGSRRYAERLAAGLAAAGQEVTVIAGSGEFGAPRQPVRGGTRLVNGLWAFARWPSLTSVVEGERPDVVHAAEKVVVPPVPRGIPLAVTVHDVWCIVRPDACGGRLGRLVRRTWRTRDRWDLVLTGTEATRTELAELGFPAERVAVTPYGVDPAFLTPAPEPKLVRARLGLPERNLVYVGPLSTKKGGDLLLRALHHLRAGGHPDLELAVRGPKAFDEVAAAIPAVVLEQVRPAVRFLPPLPDKDLAGLYAQAAAVVCPSRHEGYQFPLVESLAVGASAVATDIPVHREVSQGAALLVAREDPDALADGIDRTLSGERPKATFIPPRWEDTVTGTLVAYQDALTRV
jgi:glycosyltransferase involved in cell wall biosynthesis